jgi:hypothetical protein
MMKDRNGKALAPHDRVIVSLPDASEPAGLVYVQGNVDGDDVDGNIRVKVWHENRSQVRAVRSSAITKLTNEVGSK